MRVHLPSSPLPGLAALLFLLSNTLADQKEDDARLGQYYTSIPIYRSGSGTNVVQVGLGTPAQEFNLTLSE